MNTFYYLGYRSQDIEGDKWLKISVLSKERLIVLPIYKKENKTLVENLNTLDMFDDISNLITFAIKSNGKVTLDINF